MAIHRFQQENAVDSFSPSEEEDFGAFIEHIRRRSRIQIQEVVAQFPEYLKEWDRFTYSHLVGERKRTPLFEELLPLYQALVVSGVHFGAAERNHFLALARLKIESKHPRKGTSHPTEQQWQSLRAAFAAFDQLPLNPASDQGAATSLPAVQSFPPLQEDRRHLIGRDDWIQDMRAYLYAPLPKKLVVVQATMGAGKSSGLNLLRRSLEESGDSRIIFFACASPSGMTHEEQLDQLLAAILAHLGAHLSEAETPPPLPQRIRHCLQQLALLKERTVIFLDNGEAILDEGGQLSQGWQQFLADFLHYQHAASLFIATRTWPTWKVASASSSRKPSCRHLLPKQGLPSGNSSALTACPNRSCARRVSGVEATPG